MKIYPNHFLLDALQCPICKSSMVLQRPEKEGSCTSLCCKGAKKHCYDVASSGYVNLMPPGHTAGGDSKQAVAARTRFLDQGYYQDAALALCELISQYQKADDGIVVDAGCGEGYYTSFLAKRGFSVAGLDLSRAAAEASAKRLAREGIEHAFFGVASVFSLPFQNESASVVVNIFAPCVEQEYARVLKPNGILAVMYAGPEHLMGLKHALYDVVIENDIRADLPKNMKLLRRERVRFEISVLGNENLQNLFAMTPYYWRTSQSDSEKLKALNELSTPVDMIIDVYQKTSDHLDRD